MINKLLFTLKIERENDRMTITAPNYFCLFVLVTVGFFGAGIYMLISIISGFTGEAGDYIGIVFMLVWLSVIVWMNLMALRQTRTITVDKTGVTEKPILPVRKPKCYAWSEIIDWGITYAGESPQEGKAYTLYFSDHPMLTRQSNLTKRLVGQCIKLDFYINEYEHVATEFIPFCADRASVKPFNPISAE